MGYTPKKMTKEEEEALEKVVKEIWGDHPLPPRGTIGELRQIENTCPRLTPKKPVNVCLDLLSSYKTSKTPVNDCLDFLSRFELKPFNLVRTFHTRIHDLSKPESGVNTITALRLYARNLEVPLTDDDLKECILTYKTYWVLLRFQIFEDTADKMKMYETKILSGDYDFGDVEYTCACEPLFSYMSSLRDNCGMSAYFRYLTDPNCSEKDKNKALEIDQQLYNLSLFLN